MTLQQYYAEVSKNMSNNFLSQLEGNRAEDIRKTNNTFYNNIKEGEIVLA